MNKTFTTIGAGLLVLGGAYTLITDAPEDVATIQEKQSASISQKGAFEQVKEEDVEAFIGKKPKNKTRIDVYDGPAGKGYRIVEMVEVDTGTSTELVEHVTDVSL